MAMRLMVPKAEKAPPPALVLGADGPAVVIHGAKGEAKEYPVSPAPAPEGGWACRLGEYVVTWTGAWWECTCDHHKHKGRCKHARDAQAIRALVALWVGKEEAAEVPPPQPQPKRQGKSLMEMAHGDKAGRKAREVEAREKARQAQFMAEAAREAFPRIEGTAPPPAVVLPGPAPVTREDVEGMIQAAVTKVMAAVAKQMKA